MQTDYIMRMIEEFFRALRGVIGKRQEKNYDLAREGLDNLSRMITGLNVEQIKTIGAENIMHFFNLSKPEDIEKIFCTAKILKEQGLIEEDEGNIEESKKSFGYSLNFFELIKDKKSEDQQEVLEEITQINNKIRG